MTTNKAPTTATLLKDSTVHPLCRTMLHQYLEQSGIILTLSYFLDLATLIYVFLGFKRLQEQLKNV
jgi:hypothetical protein